MEVIFHEKQEGALCAQHCLNALLQGSYFTAVDLATLGQNLDDTERQLTSGADSSKQPSGNMDDSGYFSLQVIIDALNVWNLKLIPYSSKEAIAISARQNPLSQVAFICNYKYHWFTVRKIGNQWFNLNSLLTGPELISDTFLTLFLVQLQQEKFDIFVVVGSLPESEADNLLKVITVEQTVKPQLLSEEASGQMGTAASSSSRSSQPEESERELIEEEQLQEALRLSLEDQSASSSQIGTRLSSNEAQSMRPPAVTHVANEQQTKSQKISTSAVSTKILTNSSTLGNTSPEQAAQPVVAGASAVVSPIDSMTEEEMLEAAIKMSMDLPNS